MKRTVIIVSLCLALSAQAATYYCDAAQTGTNHAGTDADPYSEADLLSKSLEVQWQPGDAIYCKGAFGNIISPDQTYGSAGGGYVTWAAWPGFTPDANFVDMPDNTANVYLILDGWNVDRGWTDDDPGDTIDLDDTSYIQIKNCIIQGGRNATLTTEDFAPYFIVLDGNPNACISDASGSSDYITVDNCAFSNTFTGIYVNGSNWTIKDSNFLSHIASDGIVLTNSTSACVVQDCQFNDVNENYGMFSWPGTATGTWTGHQYEGVTNSTSGHSGKFIEISTAGRLRIVADDVTAKPVRGESAGSKWVLDSNNAVYFTVSGDGDSAHNDCVEVVGGNDGAEDIVERCRFGPNLRGYFAKLEDNGDDPYIEFRNNVGWAYDTGSYVLHTQGAGGRMNIYGNTLVNVDNLNAGIMINYMNKHLYNNILSGGLSYGTDPIYDTDADYNVWVVKPTSTFLQGEHDISPADVDAIFVDYAGRDFNLAPGSGAINAGLNDSDYYTSSDYTAVADMRIDNQPPDMGAYEYVPAEGGNNPPAFDAIGSKSVNENTTLTFTISATDADGDTITYSAQNLPTGATFSGQTFAWTPGYTQAGAHNVTFVASDGTNQDSELVTITVSNVNRVPALTSMGSKSVNENALLTFTTSASDADGDSITYSASSLPAGATYSSGSFSWTPGYTQAGPYEVTFTASDGTDTDSETITITVSNVNRAPALATIDNKSVSEGSLLSFSLSATDADSDTVTYTASSLPAGSAFAGSTFTWTPGYTQAGSFQVTFTASDGHAQDSKTVTITINNTNRAPVLDAIPDKSVNENILLTFGVSAADPDGDTLSYSATGLPSGATFAGQTFSWTPSASQADSSHQVTFIGGDGQLDDSQIVTITVTDASAPSVSNLSPAAGSIQAPLNSLIVLHVTDAGTGVNAGTVTITLDGSTIYSGDTSNYVSATGNCRRIGTAADYTYAYQSSQDFDFDQTKTVTVNATDLGGNVMTQVSYSFRTEMRSFGQNKLLGSDIERLDKGAPATARDSSGNIWAVWHAGPAGSRDIYLAKLTAGSTSFGAGVQITTDASDQCNPAVALGTDGKLYVVWQDKRRGDWDIYGSTSTGGTTWSAQQRITDSNDNQINPAIAVDRQSPNRAHVAWQDDRAGNQDIYIATSSNSFATNTPTRITSNTANQTAPAVAVSSSNTVYVLWTDARNSSKDIYGAAGSSWTNIPVVTKAADQSSPAIAVESTGSVLHILWVDQTSGNSDIYYASSNGLPSSPLTGTNLIDDTSGAEQTSPAIAVTGSTGSSLKVFACWADERNISGGAGDTDIYMVQANAGSGTNVLISDGSANSNQTEPATGTDRYGYPYIVWTDDRGANTEIYFAASTYMQSPALASQLITPASGGTVGTGPDDASVVAPAGACPYDVTISITKIENPQEFATRQLSSYDFGPSGIEFSRPVTVTIPYAVASSGTSPSAYWYDSLTGALSQQGITDIQIIELSAGLHALRFKTTHFTPFCVVLGTTAATAVAAGGAAGGGGGGGGGGGCSMSPAAQGNAVGLLIPYVGLAVVMTMLKLRDARNRRPQGPLAGGAAF